MATTSPVQDPKERARLHADALVRKATSGEDGSVTHAQGAWWFIHVIPFSALDYGAQMDMVAVRDAATNILPIGSGGTSHRFTFDGLLRTSDGAEGVYAYSLACGNGLLEGACKLGEEGQPIGTTALITNTQRFVFQCLAALSEMALEVPVFIIATAVGVKGRPITISSHDVSEPIDRDHLGFIPIETSATALTSQSVISLLRPIFERLANAGGRLRCAYYQE